MREIGLGDVKLEPVPVDAWSFRGADVAVGSRRIACSAFGGARPTPPGGITAELVYAGRGSRAELERAEVRGRIVLFDWPGDHLAWPSLTAANAAAAGAVASICTCLPGGAYYQAPRALGSFDGMWLPGAHPQVFMAKEDALDLMARLGHGPLRVHMTLDADLRRGATGHNVVGTLPGSEPGPPIVIAGHHDCWLGAAFDDATGVASTLALARAMRDSRYTPRRPIVFSTHTAEEYGLADGPFGWLIGAWWQIEHAHPDWQESAPLYLNIEGTGMTEPLPLEADAPAELRAVCSRVFRESRRAGLLPNGVVRGFPRTGTEVWPWVAAGVPSIGVSTRVREYMRREYHTQFDRVELIDVDDLVRSTRVYLRLVDCVDADPAGALDLPARARDLRRRGGLAAARRLMARETLALEQSLDAYERAAASPRSPAGARRAFHRVATVAEGLSARDKQSLSHLQALRDLEGLAAARSALARGGAGAAARAASRVGRNKLARHLREEVFAADFANHRRDHAGRAWGARHHTPSPNLWRELAALRGERGAPAAGPWVDASLARAEGETRVDAETRLRRLTRAFEGAADAARDPT
jgi:Iap family predicted aminopeptidase